MSSDTEPKDRDLMERDRFLSPWKGFGLLDMDRFFKDFTRSMMQPLFPSLGMSEDWRQPFSEMNYNEERDEITLTLEMPGIQKEDIKLNVSENSVKVKAVGENRRYMRAYTLPREIDLDKTEASLNNGILEVTLKLVESEQGHFIDIE